MLSQFRARLVTYADDFVILSRGEAAESLEWTRGVLERLGLTLNEKKTSIVARAFVRVASRLFSTHAFELAYFTNKCRDESRHGTHECARYDSAFVSLR
jgi:hypothetical protein